MRRVAEWKQVKNAFCLFLVETVAYPFHWAEELTYSKVRPDTA